MTAKSKHRGHEMYFDESIKQWRYSDDDSFVKDTERPCGVCFKIRTSEGHDPCLGTLMGVRNACCGHGDDGDAYVVFDNGERLSGVQAISYFKEKSMTDEPPVPYRKSRKGRKPFVIECRFMGRQLWPLIHGRDWRVWRKYKTEKACDEAMNRLRRKIRTRWEGVYLSDYEYRMGEIS